MKKITRLILSSLLVMGFTASLFSCGGNNAIKSTNSNKQTEQSSTQKIKPSTTSTSKAPTSSSKVVHNHEWDEGVITKLPSLTADGEMKYSCATCNETKIEAIAKLTDKTNYSLKASLVDANPGVYTVKAGVGATIENSTIGIPSISKLNLTDYPTYETPAIVQGAAFGYETKTPGVVEYKTIEGAELKSPYSKFRYKITDY